MKTLIVEDDFTSRLLLQELLKHYGSTHIAVNGKEAVAAVRLALDSFEPYDLICLDVMMPEMDGHEALQQIRALEASKSIRRPSRIIMTTALVDVDNVMQARDQGCDRYLAKPIIKATLLQHLRELALIP